MNHEPKILLRMRRKEKYTSKVINIRQKNALPIKEAHKHETLRE